MNDGPTLICYDGTEDSRRGIYSAARVLSTKQAIVLNVAPFVTASESYAEMVTPMTGAAFEQANEEEAVTRAKEGAEVARDAGFEAKPRTEVSAPTWEGIVDVAAEIDAAVIVIGSRGLTGAREVFEGSLSHQVAEHAGRPVLIVPPPRDH